MGWNPRGVGRASTHEGFHREQVQRLKQLLAEKTLEVDFFKGAFARNRGSTPEADFRY